MIASESDSELADQLRERKPEAIAAIYDRFSVLVFSLFLRITKDRSVAEDLVQELFLRVWNRAEDYDQSRGSLGVWVISIARNMGIDYVRSAHARFHTKLQPIGAAQEQLRQSQGLENSIDQHRAVREAFEQLNTNQRRVLELAYFEGYSQSEIATRLDEPLGTVKSWTRSALQHLRWTIDPQLRSSKEVR